MGSDYDPRLSIRGEGPAVILVPGMNGTGELFYRQVPRLERSYRVATYSLREDAERLDELAADLAHIVEVVAPVERRAIVVGESFGGAVALTFALNYPEHVAALVILNSFPHFAPQLRLRLAIAGLTVLPWGAMPLVRHLTAFRLHSPHTHRMEVKQFIELTAHATRDGYINRILSGHGHICLIAPDLDLSQILHEWQAGSDRRLYRTTIEAATTSRNRSRNV